MNVTMRGDFFPFVRVEQTVSLSNLVMMDTLPRPFGERRAKTGTNAGSTREPFRRAFVFINRPFPSANVTPLGSYVNEN